jgi:LPS O-antigen subunit length determinant protein (WzzB/FepE family)
MQEISNNHKAREVSNEIDIKEILLILIQKKFIVISVTALISIMGVAYSLQLPNIYQSKALLVPIDSSSGISGALGQYSGLAGLAGINLPSDVEGNSIKALNKLKSLSFFENNVMPRIFLPNLMAVESWDYKTNLLSYDEDIYNKNTNTWVRKYSYPIKQIPSAQESFAVFMSDHMTLSEDKKTGFVTLKIKHQSPFVAKQWSELIVNEVNNFYRQKDKSESKKSVTYLNEQIAISNLSEIKQVIAELLQQETQKLALIEASQYYVYDYIDPPAVMETKNEPSRALICILSALLGGMLSIIIVLIGHYNPWKKAS